MNALHRMLGIIVGLLLMFVAPQLYFSFQQDLLTQEVVEHYTRELSKRICSQGELTQESLHLYRNRLGNIDLPFELNITHKELCAEPEYRFKTLDEVIADQDKAYTGTNHYTYREVISKVPIVSDTIPSDSNVTTETNESILENSSRTDADVGHIHKDDCYNGKKHNHTTACYKRHEHSSSCYTQTYCSGTWSGNTTYNVKLICPHCNTYQGSHENVSSPSVAFYCSVCKKRVVASGGVSTGSYYGSCSKCSASYNASTNWSGRTHGSITSLVCTKGGSSDLSCTLGNGYYDPDGKQVDPMCNQIIQSIQPTHPVQIIYLEDACITTATVIYMDGSSEVVVCDTTFEANRIGEGQEASIVYDGFDTAATRKIFDMTIIVHVISRKSTCGQGHDYYLGEGGVDEGCPYCRAWLKHLQLVVPSDGFIKLYQHTTLESSGVTLLAVYLDGRMEYVTNGYEHNLDAVYIGHQVVTIGYKGRYVTLNVETLRQRKECIICKKFYEKYPDGSDPGCPYCISITPIFTGNCMIYYREHTWDEIFERICNQGRYSFQRGDLLRITVRSTRPYRSARIQALFGIRTDASLHVQVTDTVRDHK